MFQWDKTLKNLDVPADQLLQLFRSMRDVQMALPGTSAQESSAYLCQYRSGERVGTLVAFHLHKSGQLAIYADDPLEVPADRADRVLDQALIFVESMGFLMNDLDIQLLSASDRSLLWESLPLQKSVADAALQRGQGKPTPPKPPAPAKAAPPLAALNQPAPAAGPDDPFKMPPPPAAEEVDDLLAAVEALRARRPGVHHRRKAPSPEELRRRRQELLANVGRILASL